MISDEEYQIIMPPEPKYSFRFNKGNDYVVHTHTRPNIFHRFMQRVCLGIHWGGVK